MMYQVVMSMTDSTEELILETCKSEKLARAIVEALRQEDETGAAAYWVNETL